MNSFWDRVPVKFWGILLVVMFFWPISCTPKAMFTWDLLSEAGKIPRGSSVTSFDIFLNVLMPHLAGIAALLALRADRSSKLRGVVYAIAGGLTLFFGMRLVLGGIGSGGFLGLGSLLNQIVLLVCMFMIGPALVAAGNRVQKREDGATLPRVFAGLGGLAIVAGFLIPFGDGRASFQLIEIFGQGEFWSNAWYLGFWMLGFFVFGLFGAVLLIPGGDPERRGRAISVLARTLLVGLGVVMLIFLVSEAPKGAMGEALAALVRSLGTMYGVLIILACGLALLMESPTSDPRRIDHADAF